MQNQNCLTEMEIFRNHARTEGGCIINSTNCVLNSVVVHNGFKEILWSK